MDAEKARSAAGRLGMQIAIDGPASAGKSTVGRGLAAALGCPYLDTGLMYRAVTLLTLNQARRSQPPAALAASLHFSLQRDAPESLIVNGRPAGAELRTPEVDMAVSHVAADPEVRVELVRQQRELAGNGCIVMVGRDIGTTVLPQAPVKIWVTASEEERARRRLAEHLGANAGKEQDVLEALRARDTYDAARAASPFRRAPDAVDLNTDGLTPVQAVQQALQIISARAVRLQAEAEIR